jgi:excisionase family DNA binding protein
MMTEGKLLFRPEEAADALGVSRARLYELMARGDVRSVKIGASRRVPAVDLEAYVSRLRSETNTNGQAEPTLTARATA